MVLFHRIQKCINEIIFHSIIFTVMIINYNKMMPLVTKTIKEKFFANKNVMYKNRYSIMKIELYLNLIHRKNFCSLTIISKKI
jgi:hypothetical protein